MCKSWSITYDCAHVDLFRLSRCRGTIFTFKQDTATAACMSYTTLGFRFSKPCGPCQKETKAVQIKENTLRKGWAANNEKEVEKNQQQEEQGLWQLEREFPSAKASRVPKLKTTVFVRNKQSSLSNELKPEDIEDPLVRLLPTKYDHRSSRNQCKVEEPREVTIDQWHDTENGMESAAQHSASFDEAAEENTEDVDEFATKTLTLKTNRLLESNEDLLSCPSSSPDVHGRRASSTVKEEYCESRHDRWECLRPALAI